MHEYGIVVELFKLLEKEMKQAGGNKVTRVDIKVGTLANIKLDYFVEVFYIYSKGTFAEGAIINIEKVQAQGECNECKNIFDTDELLMECPRCGSYYCKLIKGDELLLNSIEIDTSSSLKGSVITVKGTVQGVGFRPFVYKLAKEMKLNGFVKNTSEGVVIHIEGGEPLSFIERLKKEAPPNARIDSISLSDVTFQGYTDFTIYKTSQGDSLVFTPPDLFTCKDCQNELFDSLDRRYLYPFINCTNCGPRYSIVKSLPYDREKTTMKSFKMCDLCKSEYEDPLNRRFHAQPNACPLCGPKVFYNQGEKSEKEAIREIIKKIKEGKIVAVKGIGGFHLICDPFNEEGVKRLRILKRRERKPFALMAKDIEEVKKIAFLNSDEEKILTSPQRPIVLLRKKIEIPYISPKIGSYGIMLPYTPLHLLITNEIPLIIATSANLKESPIIKDENEGIYELAEEVLTHNREIAIRCDDSVLKVVNGEKLFLRRGRGFVPEPLELHFKPNKAILALGGELKNTISIIKDNYLLTSQYLGDMKDLRNKRYMEEVLAHFSTLYSFSPEIVVSDMHPDFITTRMAEESGKKVVKVQHHISHIFAVMAEYNLKPDISFLGVAFDGVGFGEDQNIWGGEFFIGKDYKIERKFHLRYIPQQGGDLSTKEPWRMGLSYLIDADEEEKAEKIFHNIELKKLKMVKDIIKKRINSPLTSSIGRLFDAVSAIINISPEKIDYEAEAAMRLESIADENTEGFYNFEINSNEIDVRKMIKEILVSNEKLEVIAGKFHNTIAKIILEIAKICKERYCIERVIVGGGVFLNSLLLKKTVSNLKELGIEVYVPKNFSPGDESISVGQAYYTAIREVFNDNAS